jgi:S1-C subfamily serine protease
MPRIVSAITQLTTLVIPFVLLTSASGQDCSDQAAHFRQGVVSLEVKKIEKGTGRIVPWHGTGFIVSPDGFVLTADHIVARDESTDEVQISGSLGSLFAQGSQLRVVEEDKSSDVAMLKFRDGSRIYTPIRFGNPWAVPMGALLCSLGFSAPLNADYRITTGSLSSLTGQDDANGVDNLWTTQLPSNPGESGSPVLHLPDKGVVAIKYGGERPGVAQNVNYIIPLNLAQPLLLKYAGIVLPHPSSDATVFELLKRRLEKLTGDKQVIPVGGWEDFKVKVLDATGKPVEGAKVAWRTPIGGSLTYVSQTDALGVAEATNLYTFPTAGAYVQTAMVVSGNTPTGFIDDTAILTQGPATSFTFEQK